jgi:hypothetical protein
MVVDESKFCSVTLAGRLVTKYLIAPSELDRSDVRVRRRPINPICHDLFAFFQTAMSQRRRTNHFRSPLPGIQQSLRWSTSIGSGDEGAEKGTKPADEATEADGDRHRYPPAALVTGGKLKNQVEGLQ